MRAWSVATGVLTLAAGVLAAKSARAEDTTLILGSRHKNFESPQNFAFELRLAPYTPAIDSDPALHDPHLPSSTGKPYQDTFGTAPRLEVAVEFDWQILRIPHAGTLGVGGSVGYTSMSADAVSLTDRKTKSDTTELQIYPMYAVAVFRADVLMREARIPLVPYAKAGLGYAPWRASTTVGTVSRDGVPGKGQSFGYHLAGGVAFQLDVLDPTAAKNADTALGINHTYVFAEWMYAALNGIAQTHVLRVGTSTWVAGLAFEF